MSLPDAPLPPAGEPPEQPPKSHLLYLVAVAGAIILLIVVLGVLAAKRKRKHGILWLPDGFLAKKDGKRREPVGQDDFGMKYGTSPPLPCLKLQGAVSPNRVTELASG